MVCPSTSLAGVITGHNAGESESPELPSPQPNLDLEHSEPLRGVNWLFVGSALSFQARKFADVLLVCFNRTLGVRPSMTGVTPSETGI